MKEILLIVFGYCVRFVYDKISALRPKVVFNIEAIKGSQQICYSVTR